MTPTAVGVIQARMSSSRLPSKILAPVAHGQPLLGVLVRRLAGAGIDWWLATSTHHSDDVTAAWGKDLGLHVERGSLDDVLSRFASIARRVDADWIVRVTADDPLMHGDMIRRLIDAAGDVDDTVDLIGDLRPDRRFPLGFLPQLVRRRAVIELDERLGDGDAHHRSHVTSALIPDRATAFRAGDHPHRPDWRWTVDTVDDLAMVRSLFDELGPSWPDASYETIVRVLDERPDIVARNAHIQQRPVIEG